MLKKILSIMKQPISFDVDLVYTYCDDNDPEFRSQLEYWRERLRDALVPPSASHIRFTDYGELRYSLRSVEKFAPWIRNIYIITPHKKIPWLNLDCGRHGVRVIAHEDLIPLKSDLPLFNSAAIELYLDRIAGLSEHFIYLNNDCFFGNHVAKADFFTAEGKCRINFAFYLSDGCAGNARGLSKTILQNSLNVLKTKFAVHKAGYAIHQAHPLSKNTYAAFKDMFAEEIAVMSRHRFRDPGDIAIMNVAYPFYVIYRNKGVISRNFHNRFFSDQINFSLRNNLGDNDRWFKRLLRRRPRLFCIDDGTSFADFKVRDQLKSCMEKYFPHKSQFEN